MSLRHLLLLLLLSVPLVHAQEETALQELSVSEAQIALSIYLDESGRVVILGYAEESQLESLPFLALSKYKFNNETNELYALTDALTSKRGEVWGMNFSIDGVYSDFSATFYFPQGTAISKITVSNGLEYYISAGNESIEVAVQGFNVAAPEILVNYRLAIEKEKKILPNYLIAIVILLAAVIVILVRVYRREEKVAEEAISKEKKEIAVTSEMKKVMETLSENERRIVETLIREGGKATQAKIRRETGIAKSSLSGHLNALQRKKIIDKREYGRTNIIELSAWFLEKKEGE